MYRKSKEGPNQLSAGITKRNDYIKLSSICARKWINNIAISTILYDGGVYLNVLTKYLSFSNLFRYIQLRSEYNKKKAILILPSNKARHRKSNILFIYDS